MKQSNIQIADLGSRVHIVVNGRSLCGEGVKELDLLEPVVGLPRWNESARQCGTCNRRLQTTTRERLPKPPSGLFWIISNV